MKGSENQSVECQPDDAFRLNCRLMSHIADATDERLFVWTDKRMIGRAYGYLDKLESITLVEERGIVALAHGEKDYYTNVFIGDDGHLFIDKLADVYASEGNFAYAAALLAENWLAIVGGINHCDNQYGLERILDMAEKAGFRREVFAALAHAVDTRVPPHGVASKDEPLWCSGKKILPPPFIDRLPPRWPLPPSGLDLGVPNPLFQIEAHWWRAETVLIRVAINEGLFDEAAHRYLKLPDKPGHTFDASKEDGLTEFERIVQKALAEKYSDVAQKIAQISNHRKMVWSNYRNYR